MEEIKMAFYEDAMEIVDALDPEAREEMKD